jgi:hypothetical protein
MNVGIGNEVAQFYFQKNMNWIFGTVQCMLTSFYKRDSVIFIESFICLFYFTIPEGLLKGLKSMIL